MIEIKVPKEITEYKSKFMFGLTVRQFISLAAALGICVPLYIFEKDFMPEDLVSWLIMLIGAPVLAFGFFRFHGMTFEQFLLLIFRQKFVEPQRRKYIELPVFWYCREEIIEEEIAHQTAAIKRQKGRNKDGK